MKKGMLLLSHNIHFAFWITGSQFSCSFFSFLSLSVSISYLRFLCFFSLAQVRSRINFYCDLQNVDFLVIIFFFFFCNYLLLKCVLWLYYGLFLLIQFFFLFKSHLRTLPITILLIWLRAQSSCEFSITQ